MLPSFDISAYSLSRFGNPTWKRFVGDHTTICTRTADGRFGSRESAVLLSLRSNVSRSPHFAHVIGTHSEFESEWWRHGHIKHDIVVIIIFRSRNRSSSVNVCGHYINNYYHYFMYYILLLLFFLFRKYLYTLQLHTFYTLEFNWNWKLSLK